VISLSSHTHPRSSRRLAREDGFTLIELLVVLVILGILIAIAVPSYLGFRGRAADAATKASLRAAMPSAEAYYAENLTYVGMDHTTLAAIDAGLSPTLVVASAAAQDYCLTDVNSGRTWSLAGPGASPLKYFPNATCT
jgi:type IV pilus assembly protein PilA